MIEPNVLTSIPANVLGVLVMIAFSRYALRLSGSATMHLGAALFWFAARGVGRSVWWDSFEGFSFGNAANWVWNMVGLYAAYHALLGFKKLLPVFEQQFYSIVTAPFYPRRLWRRWKGKAKKGK